MSAAKAISQKEYLKKYLSSDKKVKKKSKKSSKTAVTIRIIDDDENDTHTIGLDDELLFAGEDAPQIVEIIDERPDHMKNELENRKKWKSLSNNDEGAVVWGPTSRHKDNSPVRKGKSNFRDMSPQRRRDMSPPRKSRHIDMSPPRKADKDISPPRRGDRDMSPPRKSRHNDMSPPRKTEKDMSPPRRRYRDTSPPRRRDVSPPRKSRIHDMSPSTKNDKAMSPVRRRDTDISPPRRKNIDPSPPRNRKTDLSPPRKGKNDSSPPRRKVDDLSPPRKKMERKNDDDQSPPRKKSTGRNDQSPVRRKERVSRFDKSPPRRTQDLSPPRKTNETNDLSPVRQQKPLDKVGTTLDGKKSGLLNAKSLKSEIETLREKENKLFENLSSDISGRHAEVKVRSRSYRRGQADKDEVVERQKAEREQKKKEIYDRWGKGLKQIEAYQSKMSDEIHEGSKPLARYSDDTDLDEMLKNQQRAGDPMLEYMRSKEKEKRGNVLALPIYKGPFQDNRFNIRPGYRWDGLDRSNGYEKKWFEVQNQKKAMQEEAYRYSTEDM